MGMQLAKIVLFTVIFVFAFEGGKTFFFTENEETTIPENETYNSAYSSNFWFVGVALSTRVGIGGSNYVGDENGYYSSRQSLGSTAEERAENRKFLLSENMLYIREYLNLSRTDVKAMLDSSPDRRKTLESFISQLEIRYKNAALSIQNLESDKKLYLQSIQNTEKQIEEVKTSMESHFSESLSDATLWDVESYFVLRNTYTEAFTDIVFINQFLKQYDFLNQYNKKILDTLINNKEAIVNQTYVVIPDSGDEYLRPYDLLFDEAEIKEKNASN